MLNANSTLKFNKLCVRLLSSSVLASLSILVGLIPEISGRSPNIAGIVNVSLARNVYAQGFTPEETESYAKTGYEVELIRRELYKELKNLINEPPPNILCDQQSTIDNLEPEAQAIANRYCAKSLQVVQQSNLSISRFNELKARYDAGGEFYEQVQAIIRKLQN